jgi:hypothetical protein
MNIKKLIAIGITLVFLMVGLSGCTEITDRTSNKDYKSTELPDWDSYKTYTVKYKVDGCCDANEGSLAFITYSDGRGGTSQRYAYSYPWEKTLLSSIHAGEFLYVSAQNQNDWGWIDVYIYVDGKEVKHTYSSGAYCIASASCIL